MLSNFLGVHAPLGGLPQSEEAAKKTNQQTKIDLICFSRTLSHGLEGYLTLHEKCAVDAMVNVFLDNISNLARSILAAVSMES